MWIRIMVYKTWDRKSRISQVHLVEDQDLRDVDQANDITDWGL